jgi:hypothetical protein
MFRIKRYELSKKNNFYLVRFNYKKAKIYHKCFDAHREEFYYEVEFFNGKRKVLAGHSGDDDGYGRSIGTYNYYFMPWRRVVTDNMILELMSISNAKLYDHTICKYINYKN